MIMSLNVTRTIWIVLRLVLKTDKYLTKNCSKQLKDIQNFFITEYNNFRINPEVIKCDYYDFLAGDRQTVKNFAGQFMSQYKWAEDVSTFMEYKVLKNKV